MLLNKWFGTFLAAAAKKSTEVLHNELPLEENINREILEEGARGVDEAITLLRYAHSLSTLSTLLYRGKGYVQYSSNTCCILLHF